MLVIQVLIIVVIVALALRVLLSTGPRSLALRRVLLALLGLFAVLSVLVPEVWTELAELVGVGRGTDLLLYGVTVAFLGYVTTSYLRFRALEATVTRLARRIALDEAPHPPRREGTGDK
jgi:hypothetical protein